MPKSDRVGSNRIGNRCGGRMRNSKQSRRGRSTAWAIAAVLAVVASTASAQTLDRVRASGVLTIGYRVDARPFSFEEQAGEPSGFSIELCRAVGADIQAELGLNDLSIEYVPVSTEERFQAVARGDVDILCGASTVTLARREIVSFSIPIFQTGISAAMRADASPFLHDTLALQQPTLPRRAAILQAFANRTFGVRADTTAESWLRDSVVDLASNADVVTVDSHDEGLRQVRERELDVYFADRAILLGLVRADTKLGELLVGERLFTNEPYGLALRKGDEDFRLLVDRSLSRIYRSLEIESILAEHLGRPGPQVLNFFLATALPE